MKVHAQTQWQENLRFIGRNDRDHSVQIEGPKQYGGVGTAMTPVELLLSSLGGCVSIAMMASIQEEERRQIETLNVEVEAELSDDLPKQIEKIHLTYNIKTTIPEVKMDRITKLSIEKYCTVSNSIKAELTYDINYL